MPTKSRSVYFDNNGTTLICPQAEKVHIKWLKCYNPSTSSELAKPEKKLIANVQDYILSRCNVSTATHKAIFTSGASESNCFIIRACVKAFKKKLMEKGSELVPHLILSAIEHSASMECAKDLTESGDAVVSYIQPTIYGNILPEDVEKEIKPNTCLISIMYANNELPVINNIKEISKIAHAHSIPLHSDAVQVFGKYKIDIKQDGIDALSASAHKFYGPKGIGLLIMSNDLINGYKITAEVNGSQQDGLRGGTENVPAIASMGTAMKYAFVNRSEKNKKLYRLRERCLEKLSKHYKFVSYQSYLYDESELPSIVPADTQTDAKTDDKTDDNARRDIELVSLGPPEDKKGFILVNTILLAICKNKGRPFCNVDLKKFLDKKGFVISIGSACNTGSSRSSHVMSAIGAPDVIKRGVIRISFGDNNTNAEVDRFVAVLKEGIDAQCKDLV